MTVPAEFVNQVPVQFARSYNLLRPGDVVLIAGKGHEDYQEVAGVRNPFSDVDEAARQLRRRAEGAA